MKKPGKSDKLQGKNREKKTEKHPQERKKGSKSEEELKSNPVDPQGDSEEYEHSEEPDTSETPPPKDRRIAQGDELSSPLINLFPDDSFRTQFDFLDEGDYDDRGESY
ncbi:MAG: hypothetical protein C5B49_15295 [Bdellovibrio sp.]|nr:MAG: hypothetical protein C5B49_15295 [Bdellovibrio sp.]